MFFMVKKVLEGDRHYISLLCYYDAELQLGLEKTEFPTRDFLDPNSDFRIMRETPYNDLLLKIAEKDEENCEHLRPVQFVHEWGSVSLFLISRFQLPDIPRLKIRIVLIHGYRPILVVSILITDIQK